LNIGHAFAPVINYYLNNIVKICIRFAGRLGLWLILSKLLFTGGYSPLFNTHSLFEQYLPFINSSHL